MTSNGWFGSMYLGGLAQPTRNLCWVCGLCGPMDYQGPVDKWAKPNY